ncbi:tRNA pseudouridine(38-40) synthase TruA [Robertmurraya sp. DFI.2.37]|uniref:tRNA pseudouridine(38-40) synthase TruA n=1 Tax=Robertmurraya sp. DFI.2.37 TaxID=3031819 RepID=UPI001247F942|nr:tRNA pseudouridine(38-40) synthase TruA [Robertmurraya sp. DFI.2.37]MDF1509233.1 tRNA pseudouridine(38-40) synthase TruA [Robertmurraya sp. DFI.2.37]
MQRLKCKLAYDGSAFSGYQIQPNKRTVQGELEQALQKLHKGQEVKVYASGRTDAGVHARGQVIHFDTPLQIPEEKWGVALQTLLPDDIAILAVTEVASTFHARFDVTAKEYRYFVYTEQAHDPFRRNFVYHYPYSIDITAIKAASCHLLGVHDFSSFCSAKTEVEDKVREMYEIEVTEEDGLLVFRFVGNGFLYNMVRILVGTLLQVGAGKMAVAEVPVVLAKRDRIYAGKTAPPQGLYLWKVMYD